ncbi:MAG: hypothetical protein ABL907_15835 [Hyphomicrobium sp.]
MALLLIFSIGFLPGLVVQLAIYNFGGRFSLAIVLVVSLGTAFAYWLYEAITCAGRCSNTPGAVFTPIIQIVVLIGWLLPTVGILLHWYIQRVEKAKIDR